MFQDKLPFTFTPVGAGTGPGPVPTLLTVPAITTQGGTVRRRGVCPDCPGERVSGWHPPLRAARGILTALDRVGGHLQRQRAAAGLRDVHPEHQPHTRVLPADVRLPLAQLDVRVPELQDPGTVNAAKTRVHCLLVPPHGRDGTPVLGAPPARAHPAGQTHTGTGHTLPSTPGWEWGAMQTAESLSLWSPFVYPHRHGQAHRDGQCGAWRDLSRTWPREPRVRTCRSVSELSSFI